MLKDYRFLKSPHKRHDPEGAPKPPMWYATAGVIMTVIAWAVLYGLARYF